MNDYIHYLILVSLSSVFYIPVVSYIGKKSIIKKVALYFLPSLGVLAFTSYTFGKTDNYYLFIPALGALFATVFILQQIVKKPITALKSMISKCSEGDLTVLNDIDYINSRNELDDILNSIKKMNANLSEMINNIKDTSNTMLVQGEQVSVSATRLSSSAVTQAANIEEVSANLEEISGNLDQNKENAVQAESKSKSAGDGIKQVAINTNLASERLVSINKKADLINDIANNTKILSLNAAIEAARAAEHGRGFSVVSREVQKLAEYTEEIAKTITEEAKSSVDLASMVDKFLGTAAPEVYETADMINAMLESALEQGRAVDQIVMAMNQLNEITQENSAGSEELSVSAEQMFTKANEMNKLIKNFKT